MDKRTIGIPGNQFERIIYEDSNAYTVGYKWKMVSTLQIGRHTFIDTWDKNGIING